MTRLPDILALAMAFAAMLLGLLALAIAQTADAAPRRVVIDNGGSATLHITATIISTADRDLCLAHPDREGCDILMTADIPPRDRAQERADYRQWRAAAEQSPSMPPVSP